MPAVRRLIHFSDERTLRELDGICRELRCGRGEAVRVLLERARGNLRRCRHDVREKLQPVLLAAEELASDFPTRDEPAMIRRAVTGALGVLADPGKCPEVRTG